MLSGAALLLFPPALFQNGDTCPAGYVCHILLSGSFKDCPKYIHKSSSACQGSGHNLEKQMLCCKIPQDNPKRLIFQEFQPTRLRLRGPQERLLQSISIFCAKRASACSGLSIGFSATCLCEPSGLAQAGSICFCVTKEEEIFAQLLSVHCGNVTLPDIGPPWIWPGMQSIQGLTGGITAWPRYGASKWAVEVLLQDLHETHGIPVSIFRCGMILSHSRCATHTAIIVHYCSLCNENLCIWFSCEHSVVLLPSPCRCS